MGQLKPSGWICNETFAADRFVGGRFSWVARTGAVDIRLVRLTGGETNFFRLNSLCTCELRKFFSPIHRVTPCALKKRTFGGGSRGTVSHRVACFSQF